VEDVRKLAYSWNPGDLRELILIHDSEYTISFRLGGSTVRENKEARGIRVSPFPATEVLETKGNVMMQQLDDLKRKSPDLRKAYEEALMEKFLISREIARHNEELSRAYDEGSFKFPSPFREQLLGRLLRKRHFMDKDIIDQDRLDLEKYTALKSDMDQTSIIMDVSNRLAGHENLQSGSMTATIGVILDEVATDYRLRKPIVNGYRLNPNLTATILGAQ
jgi:hypothetical protein